MTRDGLYLHFLSSRRPREPGLVLPVDIGIHSSTPDEAQSRVDRK